MVDREASTALQKAVDEDERVRVGGFVLRFCGPARRGEVRPRIKESMRIVESLKPLKSTSMSFWYVGERARVVRTLVLLVTYAVGLSASLMAAYLVHFDFHVPPVHLKVIPSVLGWVVPLKLILLFLFRQQRVLPSSFSIPDFLRLPCELSSSESSG